MPQNVITRNQLTIPYTAGARVEADLGRGFLVRELFLQLSATIGGTAATLLRANLTKGDIWDFIDRIEIIANGSTVLRQFTGAQARVLSQRAYGGVMEEYPTSSAARIGDTTSTVVPMRSTIFIPFWQLQSRIPIETVLDTRKMSTFRIAIQWASAAHPWNGGSVVSPTSTAISLQVGSNESWGVEGEFAATRIARINQIFTSSGQNQIVRLAVGPIYRSLLFNAYNASTGAELPNAISRVKIRSGTNYMRDHDWDSLVSLSMQRSNIIPQQFVSTTHIPRAWGLLDFVQDGLLTEAPDTNGLSEFIVELDLNSAAAIDILTHEIVPAGR